MAEHPQNSQYCQVAGPNAQQHGRNNCDCERYHYEHQVPFGPLPSMLEPEFLFALPAAG
jgi:hypothetical protein